MKNLFLTFTMVLFSFSALAASQGEFDFGHPDQVLKEAYPGAPNTKMIEFKDIKSNKVAETLKDVDLGFEMGDGYYDVQTSAYYMVFTAEGKLAGFMYAALMSYTQDNDLYLVAALVNTKGKRIGEIHDLNQYSDYKDEALKELPPELQPTPEE